MTNTTQLSEKWIKASILGTIWASSEIVLGSFLHNLRVPFSGNILTAIGLVILISASYKWKEQGLFWRAGVICALLKTMSPSAVIFGPMVAILSEAFLLEFSVRIMGKTIPGFLIGSILAMSWNLIQKIFNFIIFYGYNIVEVYTNLMEYAQRQLKLHFDVVWAPFILLLVIYALFGAFSALVGIKTGRRLIKSPTFISPNNKTEIHDNFQKKKNHDFQYSIFWLIVNLIFMITPLLLIDKINFGIWVIFVIAIASIWAFRYKRALRQLVRPKLWIFFVLITMITAFVFTQLQSDSITTFDAILIGIEMNLRAIILIMGFSVLGTELYHPKIRENLAKSYFKQLPPALELSLESLPSMISSVPDLKSIIRNPVQVIFQMMSHAEIRITEIQNQNNSNLKVFIVTGEIGSGKTTCIQKLVEKLEADKKEVGGIYTSRIMENGKTTGYNIIEVSTKSNYNFLKTDGNETQERIGKFYIHSEGKNAAIKALQFSKKKNIIVIDEIGKLELNGNGWADELQNLIQKKKGNLILSVRKEVIEKVVQKWNIKPEKVFDVSNSNCAEINSEIIQKILD